MTTTALLHSDDFTVESIIKKYENRQQELTHQIKHQKYCESVGRDLELAHLSEVSTP